MGRSYRCIYMAAVGISERHAFQMYTAVWQWYVCVSSSFLRFFPFLSHLPLEYLLSFDVVEVVGVDVDVVVDVIGIVGVHPHHSFLFHTPDDSLAFLFSNPDFFSDFASNLEFF